MYTFKTLITGTITGLRISSVDGTSFLDNCAALVPYADGTRLITIFDASGRTLEGFLKAQGAGETLDAEKITNGDFASVTKDAAKTVVGITKANPGVITFAAGHGYVNGDNIYFSGLTEMTELNGQYWQLRAASGDTFQLATAYDTASLDTSGYGSAETTGGACAQKTTPANWQVSSAIVGLCNGAGALTGKCELITTSNGEIRQMAGTEGQLVKVSFTISGYVSGKYWSLITGVANTTTGYLADWSGNATKTFYVTSRGTTNALLPGVYAVGGRSTWDDITIKQVLTPTTDGVTIVDSKGGTNYNFATKNASFTYNAASYRYSIHDKIKV